MVVESLIKYRSIRWTPPFSAVPFRVRPPGNVLARTRVPYYSPCFLPSILHLLVYWAIIQMVTGEGKGVAAFTREWRFFSFSCLPTMH